jgi:hypothetical protein
MPTEKTVENSISFGAHKYFAGHDKNMQELIPSSDAKIMPTVI